MVALRAHGFVEPRGIQTRKRQVFAHHPPVVDEDVREEGVVLDGLSQLFRRCGLLVGIEEDRELPVGFEHRVFDSREVRHALRAEFLDELVEREAVVAHCVLLHLAI